VALPLPRRLVRASRNLQRELRVALPAWVTARLGLGVAFLLAYVAADELRPGARPFQLDQGLLAWDGNWYQQIAERGYAHLPAEALRFFPLFPLLGRLLSPLFLGHDDVALVVLANVLALVAGVLVYRLVRAERRAEPEAARGAWLLAVFPSAFVLALAYAESLMLVLVISAFLTLRQRHWWWAALWGVLAGLSRPVGVALVLPAAIEALRGFRSAPSRERVARVAAVAAPVVGLASYLVYVGIRFDDPWLPFTVQEAGFRGDWVNPVSRLFEAADDLFGAERLGDGLHLPFALLFLGLLVVTFRRWPVSYGAFAAAVLVVALSAQNLNSLERYGLGAFPLVLGLASLTELRPLERAALALCGAGFVSLSALALFGSYVP
jgi:general stress protein CsbA